MGTNENAPLAQPDRVFGYEPKGQGFESLTARQTKKRGFIPLFFVSFDFKFEPLANSKNLQRLRVDYFEFE